MMAARTRHRRSVSPSWCFAVLLSVYGLTQIPLRCWALVARPHVDAGTGRRRSVHVALTDSATTRGPGHHPLYHPRGTAGLLGARQESGESNPIEDDGSDEEEPRASPHSSSLEGHGGAPASSANDASDAASPVTAEMFWRDMLRDPPVVKRQAAGANGKKAKKEYRVLDNRDSLPFSVRLTTPDPYNPRSDDSTKRKSSSARAKRGRNSSSSSSEGKVSSQLFVEGAGGNKNGSTNKKDKRAAEEPSDHLLLGEYQLDKHTTTGDVLLIGEDQYKVVSHRCLYKYAGGQRFVMVKKILHVKEVGRWQAEEYLQRQWKNSPPSVGSAGDSPLELP